MMGKGKRGGGGEGGGEGEGSEPRIFFVDDDSGLSAIGSVR